MKGKIIKGSGFHIFEDNENINSFIIDEEVKQEIANIINKNRSKSIFFSESPLSKEQIEYLKNGEGVDNKDVDGETGFF